LIECDEIGGSKRAPVSGDEPGNKGIAFGERSKVLVEAADQPTQRPAVIGGDTNLLAQLSRTIDLCDGRGAGAKAIGGAELREPKSALDGLALILGLILLA
jgi:hypothetical protein